MDFPVRSSDQLSVLLRSLRRARGLTQSELAQRLGITQQALSQLEKDPGAASMERVMALLAALQATVVLRDNRAAAAEDAAW